jgi:hypothetical protein
MLPRVLANATVRDGIALAKFAQGAFSRLSMGTEYRLRDSAGLPHLPSFVWCGWFGMRMG